MSFIPGHSPRVHDPVPGVGRLALDGAFWRHAARFGASHGPSWFVRWSPPIIGAAIALAKPDLRHRISTQLALARGRVGAVRDAIDVVHTFANFASCITEVLSTGSKNGATPEATVHRSSDIERLLTAPGGIIFATAHTAGWESMGALLAREHKKRVMIVTKRERDEGARELQDAMRKANGSVDVVHVGDDPLASLPMMRHLRDGGVLALQIDRVPRGMAARAVRLFGRPGAIPAGPLRLAQLTGVPIVPAFSARTGHRQYSLHIHAPIRVDRRADSGALDTAAQGIADALESFVTAHPTHWFPFHE